MTFGYVIGIILGLYLGNVSVALFFIFINLAYITFCKLKIKRYLKLYFPVYTFILFQIFFLFGSVRITILEYKHKNLYDALENIYIVGTVDSEIKKGEYYNSFELKVESINDNYKFKGTRLIVKVKDISNIEYGNKIKVYGNYSKLRGYKNSGVFQYEDYCKAFNIYGNIKAKEIEKIKVRKNLGYVSYKIRFYIKNKIDNHFNQEEGSLLKGILLGDTENISDEIIENFRASSISHVLAVSGAHISCLIIGISFISNLIFKSTNLKKIIIIFILTIFVFIIGFSPSIIRSFIMVSLILISKLIHKKSNAYLNMVISVFIVLLYNPYYINNVSFLLSFLATFGIIYMHSKLKKRIRIENKILSYIVNIILISVYSNLFIFPIIAYFFNQVSFSFFITNLFISPIILILEIMGMIFIISPNIFSSLFSSILNIFLKLLILISNIGSKIPFSKILVSSPSIIEILLYYLFIFHMTNRKKYITRKILIILAIIVIGGNVCSKFLSPFTIYFIDVGQGDSTLIKTKYGKTILIDGGGSDSYDVGKNVLLPYILNKRIRKIDYMIISHFDSDHIKGLFAVMENLKVENIIISKQYEETDNLKNFEKIVNEKKIRVYIVKQGDEIIVDKDTRIKILWPDENQVTDNPINNNSIVAKLIYQDISILFTGDIEEVAEKKIVGKISESELKSTILKVPHHGSKTSSTEEFLEKVNPKISLIGVGENNQFGHPSNITLKKLKSINCKVYRTDEMGEVILQIKSNKKIKVKKYN